MAEFKAWMDPKSRATSGSGTQGFELEQQAQAGTRGCCRSRDLK